MRPSARPSLHRLALLALLATAPVGAARSDVLVVDAAGGGGYVLIQAAVDAAADGDVVLVRPGAYPGFTIDGKALWVTADVGATVSVFTRVRVRNLPADGDVVLAGLEIRGEDNHPATEALRVESCLGDVRIEACVLRAGKATGPLTCPGPWPDGGHALRVALSSSVVLRGCTLVASDAPGSSFNAQNCISGTGGVGGVVEAARVWLFDCELTGGKGADNHYQAGDGGFGLAAAASAEVFLSGTSVEGGKGGFGWETLDGLPGDGGAGVWVSTGSTVRHLDSTILGGEPGGSLIGFLGAPGPVKAGGGTFTQLAGTARDLLGSSFAAAGAQSSVTLQGEPGDRVWLLLGRSAQTKPMGAAIGAWLVSYPLFLTQAPHATLGATGSATLPVPALQIASGQLARGVFLQAMVLDAGGQLRFSDPLSRLAFDCAALSPDCDGNGSFDSCDLLAGATDCNQNAVLDSCEVDCNANGVPDDCDIAQGTSDDLNLDGIPDECQGFTTWHVDAAAPAGGNGSAASPFQALQPAFVAALAGDTILLADGVYSGPQNRGLMFGDRNLIVRSANGPANCVLDLGFANNAFTLGNLAQHVRIEGLTMRNGKAADGGAIHLKHPQSSAKVRDCVFIDCQGTSTGGAISSDSFQVNTGPPLRVEGCRFERCTSTYAGALYAPGMRVFVEDCVFLDNSASDSVGAVLIHTPSGAAPSVVARSVFLGNSAVKDAGALSCGNRNPASSLDVVECLFAGNSAAEGGAIFAWAGPVRVNGCTLVGNSAAQGGALRVETGVTPLTATHVRLTDSVLWDNSAAVGPQALVGLATVGFVAELSIAFCDVEGGIASVAVETPSVLHWGAGNLDVDPAFVDPDGPDNDPLTLLDNDWRLAAGSPCLDAGDNGEVPPDLLDLDGDGDTSEPIPLDLDGNPRFVDDPAPDTGVGTPPLVDLGAYERP